MNHLSIAATLLVHPTTTTRLERSAEVDAPHLALRLLRLLTTLVTPTEAKLDVAFSFARAQTSRSGHRSHAGEVVDTQEGGNDSKPLHLGLAAEDSLWSRAQDFWHVVGWAFNCSVLHPERWEYWQIWLEFMCGVIEDDWAKREQEFQSHSTQNDGSTEGTEGKRKISSSMGLDGPPIFKESLIFQYISSEFAAGQPRRIFRAIFADGSSSSFNEFRQVFDRELVLRSNKPRANSKKRDRVNIDRGQYGDYLSEDETDGENNEAAGVQTPQSGSKSPAVASKPRRSKRTRRGTRSAADSSTGQEAEEGQTTTQHAGISSIGGLGSLNIRKRLLNILLKVSLQLPKEFTASPKLFQNFIDYIRHQPLPIFQAFVSPYVLQQFSDAELSTLCELLLFNLCESSAPETEEGTLTQTKLELCFLPYATASPRVVDNIKMSILLESCIVLLAKSNMLSATDEFKKAVETGILRRAERSMDQIRRNQTSRQQEPIEWSWLVESGERLNYLVELLQPA